MTDRTAERLILMMQLNIRMEGMKAENNERKERGLAPAYGESHFQALVNEFHETAP